METSWWFDDNEIVKVLGCFRIRCFNHLGGDTMVRRVQVRVFDGAEWKSVFVDCMGGTEDFLFSTNDVLVFVTDMRNIETWSASTPATFKFEVGARHEYDGYIFEAGFVEQQSWDEETLEVLLQLGDEYHIY